MYRVQIPQFQQSEGPSTCDGHMQQQAWYMHASECGVCSLFYCGTMSNMWTVKCSGVAL